MYIAKHMQDRIICDINVLLDTKTQPYYTAMEVISNSQPILEIIHMGNNGTYTSLLPPSINLNNWMHNTELECNNRLKSF